MADEQKPNPRKRAPRKKPAATAAPVEATDIAAPVSTEESDKVGREVMTTASLDLDTDTEPDVATDVEPSQRNLNRAEIGQLYLHTQSRDIVVILDGEAAARIMSVFAGIGGRLAMQDLMHPEVSNMRNLWVSVDLHDVVALSWIPGLPSRTARVITVDPPVPEAMAT